MKKILRILFYFLLSLVAIILIAPLFLTAEKSFTQSVEVETPSNIIFKQVNNLSKWEAWSPWKKANPDIVTTYDGEKSGVGAKSAWIDEKQGNGSMVIVKSEPYSLIQTELDFENRGTGKGEWKFENSNEKLTQVTWTFTMGDAGYLGRWFGVIASGMMNQMMTDGLVELKKVSEELYVEFIKNGFDNVIEKSLSTQKIIVVKDSTTMDRMPQYLGQMYGELFIYMGNEGIEAVGAPFALYHTFDPQGLIVFEAGIPVASDCPEKGRVKSKDMYTGKAIMLTHLGDYSTLNASYELLKAYMTFEGLEVSDSPWEVYITDPAKEKDKSKWITEIYFPVK